MTPRSAEARPVIPGRFQHHICLDGFNGCRVGGQDSARGTYRFGDGQRRLVHVDGDNFSRAGRLCHGHDQASDRPAADHHHAFPLKVARLRDGMPGNAGGFGEGSRAQLQSGRQRAEHPGRQCGISAEGALGVRHAGGAAQVGASGREVGPVRGVAGPGSARGSGMDCDVNAGGRSGAVGGCLNHGSHHFVSEDQWCAQD
jgi:hypothetical protein